MKGTERVSGDHFVLSPQEALVAGGPAEQYEQQIQTLFRQGSRHLVTDLRRVTHIDSAGVRAMVRGYTTAQRLGGSFKLVGPNANVRSVLDLALLGSVFEIFDTIEAARKSPLPWDTIRLVVGGTLLCLALVWGGMRWNAQLLGGEVPPMSGGGPFAGIAGESSPLMRPFLELLKLVVAALIGVLVTAVHRRFPGEKPLGRSMEQAQTLLCVSGAMMMIIIGNSLPRAFGIAGAASIIRFRSPVEDPKDITILFLLMGLGMASGLGAFAVAGLGALFLAIVLWALEYTRERKPRVVKMEVVADGREFPLDHVQSVFARFGVVVEPKEFSQGKEAKILYNAKLDPGLALEDLSAQLMGDGSRGIKSVSWEAKKSA